VDVSAPTSAIVYDGCERHLKYWGVRARVDRMLFLVFWLFWRGMIEVQGSSAGMMAQVTSYKKHSSTIPYPDLSSRCRRELYCKALSLTPMPSSIGVLCGPLPSDLLSGQE